MTFTSAIVLGGVGGIGKEICVQLIGKGLKNLAVIDVVDDVTVTTALEAEFKNVNFLYKKCSVTDESELRKCMTAIKDEFEWVDVIVNSVGVLDEASPKRTIDINYGGVVNSTIIGIDLMRKDNGMRGGCIVNIASITALGSHFWLPVYAGSKHAVLGFTRSLINDAFFEKTGIKFMSICPGVTNTPLVNFERHFANILFPEMVDEVKSLGGSFARQEVDIVGRCVIAALEDGENGSTWQCENGRIEKLNLVEYPKF
ncbi:alcohol dehydrogenase 1-like [Bradysia coprophila]|uniref:alcohol dehydrogenase 1-like n=1 Tax=Bradysia coprophila TaxID=38358 RepID=UPI00187DC302|nr:alcohol dehydrogenase 1-like [Bradysia coprophila]